ncbi:hypothetical protein BDN72DRAFT_961567 [Pluteus cervinus]|uniref:Uncharacterized protein n=1 Tax=Pluteus cervinus TaxID=181527 RepID=A0ACD3ALQ5_9AGAR|nr:hypothetical protein BDN72DRAFT_961567 [Pluteus cervinus]
MSSRCSDYDYVLKNPSNLSIETKSTLRTQIDLEIAELKNRLHYLATARNVLAPIDGLPHEILEKIFALVQVGVKGRVSAKRILPSSWVSHKWREVALGYPLLWDHIDHSNSCWASHCLTRSKNTPLFVDLPVQAIQKFGVEGRLTKERLLGELPRCRQLNLGGELDDHRDLDDWVEHTICHIPDEIAKSESPQRNPIHEDLPINSVSLLHTLRFDGLELYQNWDVSTISSRITLQSLTKLQLKDCDLIWEEVLVPSLRTIHIEAPDPRISISDLLQHLSRIPLLEDIILVSVLSTENEAIEGGREPCHVALPNLTSFKVGDEAGPMAGLLNNVTIPLHASLSMAIPRRSSQWMQHLLPCITFIGERFNSTQLLDIVAISQNGSGHISLGFGHRGTGGITEQTTLQVSGDPWDTYSFRHIFEIFSHLSLRGVRQLHVKGRWHLLEEGFNSFVRLLETMPNVEELLFQDYAGAQMLESLASTPTTSFPPPGLSRITFAKIYSALKHGALVRSQIEELVSRRQNSHVKMILKDPDLNREGLEFWEQVFDEIYAEEANCPFFSDAD